MAIIFFGWMIFAKMFLAGWKLAVKNLVAPSSDFHLVRPLSVAAQQLTQNLPIFRVCLSLDSKYFTNLCFKICFKGIMAWEVKLYHSLSSMGGWRFASLSDIRRGTGWSNRICNHIGQLGQHVIKNAWVCTWHECVWYINPLDIVVMTMGQKGEGGGE